MTEIANAYSLLTKPTLELTDAEVELVVADLRKRRLAYVSDAKKNADRPDKAKPEPRSADERKAIAASLAAELKLDFEL